MPFTTRKDWENLEEILRIIYDGNASPIPVPHSLAARLIAQGHLAKMDQIRKALEESTKTTNQIAADLKAPVGTVVAESQRMFQETGKKRQAGKMSGETSALPIESKYLTEAQIEAWAQRFLPKIRKTAWFLTKDDRIQRAGALMDQEEIERIITETLKRELRKFEPDKKKTQRTLKSKLNTYIIRHISYAKTRVLRTANNMAQPRTTSLDQVIEPNHGRTYKKSDTVPAPAKATPPISFNQMLHNLGTRGFTREESLLLIARNLNMNFEQTGRMIRTTSNAVYARFARIKQKQGLKGHLPSRMGWHRPR